jgi:GAF domain-containing protein
LFGSEKLTVDEIAALNHLAQEITAQLDHDALLKLIIERAVQLLRGVTGGIYLFDAKKEFLTLVCDYGGHKSIVGHRLKVGEGMAGKVAQTGQSMIVNNYSAWEGRSPRLDLNHFGAVVEVPLSTKDPAGTLGVLYVSDYAQGTFSERDKKMLGLFASQAAVAINNARNLSQLKLLSNVSSRISSAITLHDILQMTLQEALRAMGTDEGSIMVVNPRTNKLEIKAWIIENKFVAEKDHRSFDLGEGIAGYVAVTKDAYICSDSLEDEKFVRSQTGRNPRSILSVPILCNDNLLCIINADNKEPHFFQQSHREMLAKLAIHVAIAIESQRLRDFGALLTSLGSAEELYQKIVESAFHLTNAELSTLFIQPEGVGGIVRAAVFPRSSETLQDKSRRHGLTTEILKTGKAQTINDVQSDPRVKPEVKARGVKALICAPLNVKFDRDEDEKIKTLGVLYVSTTQNREFSEREQEILQSLANQAAVSVANTWLYSYQQSLTSGAFDAIIAIDRMGIIREVNLSAKAVLGYEKEDDLGKHKFHAKKLFADRRDLWKISRLLLNKDNDGRLINFYTDLISKGGEPVSIRLSAILLENGIVGFFRDQRPFESANQYIEQIHGLLETGKAIAESPDLNTALVATVKKAREQLKADPVCLYYYDHDMDQILLPPIRDELLNKNAVSANVGEDSIVRRVIDKGEIFTDDTPNDPLLKGDFVTQEKIKATAAVCLKHSKENRIVGVLFCNYRDEHKFSEEEKWFIKLFATDAANAIDSAHSYQQTSRKAKQFFALSKSVKALAGNLSYEALLKSVLERAREMTDAELGALGVLNAQRKFEPFFASGIDQTTSRLIGEPPGDHGLFGQLFHAREIMLQDLERQGGSSKLPTHHPTIRSFLGVPITFKNRPIGNLYVANKKSEAEFDDEDAFGLKLLAALAALCIKSSESLKSDDENFDIAFLLFSRFARNIRETGKEISAELAKLRKYLIGTIYEESLKKISHALSDLNSPGYQVELESAEMTGRSFNVSMLLERIITRHKHELGVQVIDDSIEPVRFVAGNQLLIEFALSIILENAAAAIKRTGKPGTLEVVCSARGAVVNIVITDTGDGIPSEIESDLFQRPIKEKGIASLAAARIIRAHRGEVRIASTQLNEGTTIELSLPEAAG